MSAANSAFKKGVYFCYPNPAGFSGQKNATTLVMKGLLARGWSCCPLPMPVLDRQGKRRWATLRFLFAVLRAWSCCLRLLVAQNCWFCVNLGQTRSAFLRDAVPLLLGWAGVGRNRVIVSLHGSLFMQWANNSIDVRVFRFLLTKAGQVTVLGERQKSRLVALGIPASRVKVVINSCDVDLSGKDAIEAKHRHADDQSTVVHCLYLSSLIDTKGYPEYLEALLLVSALPGPSIDAVLCGRLVESEFVDRFPDEVSAEKWIEQQMTEINRSRRVQVRWVKGAVGAEKAALFRAAEIFVLPTRYAVEAQPLVLLEAMASGCAIITTRAGEIPAILDEESAAFLAEASADSLTVAMQALVDSAESRTRFAQAAHARFVDCYQLERHLDAWEKLLGSPGLSAKTGGECFV